MEFIILLINIGQIIRLFYKEIVLFTDKRYLQAYDDIFASSDINLYDFLVG